MRVSQRLEAMYPSAGINVVVDVVTAQLFDKSVERLAATAGSIVRDFERGFEGDLKLVVSVKKTAAVAGNDEMGNAMRTVCEVRKFR